MKPKSKITQITWLLLTNIFILLIIFQIADYLIYKNYAYKYKQDNPEYFQKIYPLPRYIELYKSDYSPHSIQKLRKISAQKFEKDDNKKSLIIFGCSFAKGALLRDEQTISYKLSNLTKRTVYSYAVCASGIQHMLYILQKSNIFEQIKTPPEYVIYIYIPDHITRLYMNIFTDPIGINGCAPIYYMKNGELKLRKSLPDFLYKTFIIKKLIYIHDYANLEKITEAEKNDFKYSNVLMNKIFIESKKLINNKYPNCKFVLLCYDQDSDKEYWDNNNVKKQLKELEENGFIILNTRDLAKRYFNINDTVEDKYHPNEAVWDILGKQIIQKLNL